MTSSNSTKKTLDVTGLKFNRLLAVEKTAMRSGNRVVWKFLCDCGNDHFAAASEVKRGATKSCGCLLIDTLKRIRTSHGATINGVRTKTYGIWSSMWQRCTKKSHRNFNRYGGRGIKVCERWIDFANFRADMGECPFGLSIDRINNDGNYEPSNCRWSTCLEQQANRSTNVYLEINGEIMITAEWARRAGRNPITIQGRLRRGLSHYEAVFGPLERIRKPKSSTA